MDCWNCLSYFSAHRLSPASCDDPVTDLGLQATNQEPWRVPAPFGTDQRISLINTCVQPHPEVQAVLKFRDGLMQAISIGAREETKVKMRPRMC